jgi:predicted enzyme related to lactoylglutathione lyase
MGSGKISSSPFSTRSDVADANAEPGRTIINVHVEDAREAVTRLNDAGVTWLTELERRPGGLFATLVDPDGSYVQTTEFNKDKGKDKDQKH